MKQGVVSGRQILVWLCNSSELIDCAHNAKGWWYLVPCSHPSVSHEACLRVTWVVAGVRVSCAIVTAHNSASPAGSVSRSEIMHGRDRAHSACRPGLGVWRCLEVRIICLPVHSAIHIGRSTIVPVPVHAGRKEEAAMIGPAPGRV